MPLGALNLLRVGVQYRYITLNNEHFLLLPFPLNLLSVGGQYRYNILKKVFR